MTAPEARRWLRVIVTIEEPDPSTVELVADRLWAHGPAAVEERDTATGCVLAAGFDDPAAAATAADALTTAGFDDVRVVPVDDDGLDAWRPWARVERAGPFDLVPAWLATPTAVPGRIALTLEPGRSFGSGSHPTTRLVLARLALLLDGGDGSDGSDGGSPSTGPTVLDVGCGSGVLAVAAARLGSRAVEAVDIDEAAPAVTAANAARNGVADRVRASDRPLGALAAEDRSFDLVLANLLAPVVAELAADLVAVLAPDGHLVVSGLLADRWREGVAVLAGLEVTEVDLDEGWAAVTLRRPAPPA